ALAPFFDDEELPRKPLVLPHLPPRLNPPADGNAEI
ncbi:hypothetical protein D023_1021, partial [Vibrio parahaemolyticus 3256]